MFKNTYKQGLQQDNLFFPLCPPPYKKSLLTPYLSGLRARQKTDRNTTVILLQKSAPIQHPTATHPFL